MLQHMSYAFLFVAIAFVAMFTWTYVIWENAHPDPRLHHPVGLPAINSTNTSVFRVDDVFQGLPEACHWLFPYIMVQWTLHFIELTRCQNLIQFLFFRYIYGSEDRAKARCEPENQGFCGV